MVLPVLLAAALSASQVSSTASTSRVPSVGNAAMEQLYLAEEDAKLGAASPDGSAERRHRFEQAAEHYQRASDLGTSALKLTALTGLAGIYESSRLNGPARREAVLRELIVLTPTDPQFAFELAALQEAQGLVDAAEDTLLAARQRDAENIDTYKRLAQFYARRVTSMNTTAREQTPGQLPNPGEPDANGVYQIGGQLAPPRRLGVALYPNDAKAAGIRGAVQAEIVVDETGAVVDARVLKSVPLLDEAAGRRSKSGSSRQRS